MSRISWAHSGRRPLKRAARRGQNLVEMLLTFPMVLVLLFLTVDVGRLWFTYEAAKMAANAGAHTAAIYHRPAAGMRQLDYKLQASGMSVSNSQVSQVPGNHAYQADVTVQFVPFFGGVSIPTLGGGHSHHPGRV